MTEQASAPRLRVADYIVHLLAQHGIQHVFLVTGGGAMHLNDAFGRCESLTYVPCHHEQACAMAAESYCRMTGRMAAVNVTTGPGATNAITGVFGAWTDSIAMIVVSGQVKRETTMASAPHLPLRQLGDQEVDVVGMVSGITKYAVLVDEPADVRFHVEKALHLAESGRPGPVWLDVPIDVQGALIDPSTQRGYDLASDDVAQPLSGDTLVKRTTEVLRKVQEARRPVVLAGAGVRLAGARDDFLALVEKLGIPVVTGWNAHDAIWDDHPLYCGRPGTVGDRSGNFAVQNADLLLVLGSRLNVRQVSYAWPSFARTAHIVMVDIDPAEMAKPTLSVDDTVHADLADFLQAALSLDVAETAPAHTDYLEWCRERRARYPVVLPEYRERETPVNPYVFVERLFACAAEDEWVVTGDGTACVTSFQAAYLQQDQRLYTNSGAASMGYDLPAAIGASIAGDGKRVVCIAGDGSIQMNIQELQTIVSRRLPIKIFLLNNDGYHSIRQTQSNYFPDNIVGCGPESGLSMPDFARIAGAYGIPFRKITSHSELDAGITATLEGEGPQFCEVLLDREQQFAPKLSSRRLEDGTMVSAPLEDLAPFLSREELADNLLIDGIPS